jgi:DNA invertase Pin-like site-specific DNA recombinase
MTNVALYVRVSDPREGRQNPEIQLSELREYAERRKWTIVQEYVDRMTGSKDSRPALAQLMTDASRRKFDAVIVWRFDRFARSVSHLLRALEQFNALGIQFISLTETVDTSTPMGKMVFTILGSVAELERNLIRERVVAGIRHAQAKGVHVGRPRLAIDHEIAARRAAGMSYRAIARELHVSQPTVWKRIKAVKDQTC